MIERYTRPEMGALWTQDAKYQAWLDVELAACRALAARGGIPAEALAEIEAKAAFDSARIAEIELEVKHDVIAFLTSVAEFVGPSSRFIHVGLTSSDVVDTGFGLQLKRSGELLLKGMDRTCAALEQLAWKYKDTVMMGRSHGIHAEPITFGLKVAVWYAEAQRNHQRLQRAIAAVSAGMLSGAVGTFANIDPDIEEAVCHELGLHPELASTQVISRDRHAEFFSTLAIIAGSIEKIAVEIRHLQRTEVLEAEEPFTAGQKGSSAMPHKRNPILSENLTGLARLLRGYAGMALEDIALWHERDISHSSVERVIGPDACIVMDFMFHRASGLLEKLVVYPQHMMDNLNKMHGLIFSQRVLLALTAKGMLRENAYRVVQRNAMQVWENNADFKALLAADPDVSQYLQEKDLAELFDLAYHTRNIDRIFARVFPEGAAAMSERQALYEGKAKIVYASSVEDELILHFKDDTSAFDGEKVEQLARKGEVNNAFNAFIMEYLQSEGVPTHFIRRLDARESLVRRLEMIPVECVVRNRAAGSLTKRLGIEEGRILEPPTLEFFLKNDALHDPMINTAHIRTFGWASAEEVEAMRRWTMRVNTLLKALFAKANLILVDFKLEFGRFHGELYLGDEFSPDGCRLWDAQSLEKMDKDRFRRNLGGVVEAYLEVAQRLGVPL